jgi:hypothetical protein
VFPVFLLRTIATVIVSAAALAVGQAAPAEAAKPCWRQVLDDWTNGTIQATYRASCYAEALQKLPTDVRLYSDASDEIRRAMLTVIRDGPTSGGPTGGASAPERSLESVGAPAEAKSDETLPVPILVALTLALMLTAAGIVGRLRAKRVTGESPNRSAPDLR